MNWTKEESWTAHLSGVQTIHIIHIEDGGYELQVEERHARRMLQQLALYPTFELAEAAAEEWVASGRRLERPWEINLSHWHGDYMHEHDGGSVPHIHGDEPHMHGNGEVPHVHEHEHEHER